MVKRYRRVQPGGGAAADLDTLKRCEPLIGRAGWVVLTLTSCSLTWTSSRYRKNKWTKKEKKILKLCNKADKECDGCSSRSIQNRKEEKNVEMSVICGFLPLWSVTPFPCFLSQCFLRRLPSQQPLPTMHLPTTQPPTKKPTVRFYFLVWWS